MLACAEEVLRRLDLHYRVVTCCAPATWDLPRRRPTTSRCGPRAERLSRDLLLLGVRRVPGAAHERALPGQGEPPAALRSHPQRPGVAVGRALIAVMETYQQQDGSIVAERAAGLHGWAQDHRARQVAHAHPGDQRRRHPLGGPTSAPRSAAHCPTTSGCWRRSSTSRASRTRSLNDPLRLREVGDAAAVKGTPTDCVIMGARHVIKDRPPDLVLSGVNRGFQRGRGRDPFRHRRRSGGGQRDPRHSSLALSQSCCRAAAGRPIGKPRSVSPPTSSGACSRREFRATCSSTSIFPIARRPRSRASR